MTYQNVDIAAMVTIAIAIVTLVRTLITSRPDVTKNKTDAISQLWNLNKSVLGQNVDLTERLDDLERKYRNLSKDMGVIVKVLSRWHDGTHQLMYQIIALGEQPVWTPAPGELDHFLELTTKHGDK